MLYSPFRLPATLEARSTWMGPLGTEAFEASLEIENWILSTDRILESRYVRRTSCRPT